MIPKAVVYGLAVLVELIVAALLMRFVLGHFSATVQLATLGVVLVLALFGRWTNAIRSMSADKAAAQVRSATAMADAHLQSAQALAAAFARLADGTGTYLITIGADEANNIVPLDYRLGLELAGIQPGAVQTYPDGTPLHREPDFHEQALADAEAADPTPKMAVIPAAYRTAAELGLDDVGAAAASHDHPDNVTLSTCGACIADGRVTLGADGSVTL